MNGFIIALACIVATVSAWDHHHHGPIVGASGVVDGHVAKGPTGSVNGHGAIGPNGEHNAVGGHWDDGHDGGHGGWGGHGAWGGHGGWGGDAGHGDWGGDAGHGHYSNVVHAPGALLVGPSAGHGGGWSGDAHGHFVLKGPATIPVTIVGPAGKVHAEGLYGPKQHHW